MCDANFLCPPLTKYAVKKLLAQAISQLKIPPRHFSYGLFLRSFKPNNEIFVYLCWFYSLYLSSFSVPYALTYLGQKIAPLTSRQSLNEQTHDKIGGLFSDWWGFSATVPSLTLPLLFVFCFGCTLCTTESWLAFKHINLLAQQCLLHSDSQGNNQ